MRFNGVLILVLVEICLVTSRVVNSSKASDTRLKIIKIPGSTEPDTPCIQKAITKVVEQLMEAETPKITLTFPRTKIKVTTEEDDETNEPQTLPPADSLYNFENPQQEAEYVKTFPQSIQNLPLTVAEESNSVDHKKLEPSNGTLCSNESQHQISESEGRHPFQKAVDAIQQAADLIPMESSDLEVFMNESKVGESEEDSYENQEFTTDEYEEDIETSSDYWDSDYVEEVSSTSRPEHFEIEDTEDARDYNAWQNSYLDEYIDGGTIHESTTYKPYNFYDVDAVETQEYDLDKFSPEDKTMSSSSSSSLSSSEEYGSSEEMTESEEVFPGVTSVEKHDSYLDIKSEISHLDISCSSVLLRILKALAHTVKEHRDSIIEMRFLPDNIKGVSKDLSELDLHPVKGPNVEPPKMPNPKLPTESDLYPSKAP